MPGRILTKITQSYVGQVVTAGALLVVAALLLFTVISSIEPAIKAPTSETAPVLEVKEQEPPAAPYPSLEAQNDVGKTPLTQVLAESGVNGAESRQTVNKQSVSQLWQGSVICDFGWQLHPLYKDWRYHNGIDISGDEGQIVPALQPGEVLEIYTDKQYGLTVVVKSDNYIIYYGSLASCVVQENRKLETGSPIGSMGITTAEPEPHLHLAVQKHERKEYYNPRTVLSK